MSTLYPTAVDDSASLPNPASTDKRNNPSLGEGQSTQNDAIKAIEAKVGTGATTPASNKVLLGTGTGTSAWQGLTSAELRGVLSDETGTGAAVFATTPTLTTPKFDTANEETAGNGMTFDSLNIKDGKLNTNNSVVTANVTAAAITPEKLIASTGTSWAWQTWAPTLSNLSGGAITYAKYIQIGKTVHFRFKYTLGGAGVSGGIGISLPVAVATGYGTDDGEIINATVHFRDTGTALFPGFAAFGSSTVISLYVGNTGSTYLYGAATSSTIPHTWANTDIIVVAGTYEAA